MKGTLSATTRDIILKSLVTPMFTSPSPVYHSIETFFIDYAGFLVIAYTADKSRMDPLKIELHYIPLPERPPDFRAREGAVP